MLSVGLVWIYTSLNERGSKLTSSIQAIYRGRKLSNTLSCRKGCGKLPLPFKSFHQVHAVLFVWALSKALRMILMQQLGGGGTRSTLLLRGCPCLKARVLLSSPLQCPRSWLPALQAGDTPRISRSRFLQRSGCYAALFISGMWHWLLVELYTWTGEPAVLERGLACQMAVPAFSLANTGSGAQEILVSSWDSTCGRAFTSRGITGLTAWS